MPAKSELAVALLSCRYALFGVAALSAVVNVLALTGTLFMLQVYDRVIPSGSVPTLVALAVLAACLFLSQAFLDGSRARIMVRVGAIVDASLSERIYRLIVDSSLGQRDGGDGLQPMRDLDQIRACLTGTGPSAFFDLPWIPFYLAICFLFHPILGLAATVGAVVLIGLTLLTEFLTRRPQGEIARMSGYRGALASSSRRNAEVLRAMGMESRFAHRWCGSNAEYLARQCRAGDIAASYGAASRGLRLMLQSTILGLGAWLVIHGQASPGIMIAGSVMMARALAPVELAIGNWKGLIAARLGWHRLDELLHRMPPDIRPLPLPPPSHSISVENVTVVPPGAAKTVIRDVSFSLQAGIGLGIIGPSGSGKTSLARTLVGAWLPARGAVRMDGATLDRWGRDSLGAHIGYLPQDVELFSGTLAENISRFEDGPDPAAVMAAARVAGIHEMVLALEQGYETQIGEDGMALSAGQRQRVALARALYRDPFLIVLDEPNSNLDSAGEEALAAAIRCVRKRGGIVAVIAHRAATLAEVDTVLLMVAGRVCAFGPREKVLAKVTQMDSGDRSGSGRHRVDVA